MTNATELKKAADYLNTRLGYNIYNDPWQKKYVKSLIDSTADTQAVFVNAEAGTGKTSLAISIAYYLLTKDAIDQIVYIKNAVAIRDLGFLPGDVSEKEGPYMQPGLDALSKLDPMNKSLIETLIQNGQLVVASTSFLRGVDWDKRKFIIVDEAQNLTINELQTVLTRPHDESKIVVIGSSQQCDEKKMVTYGKDKLLPFEVYQEHFVKYSDLNVTSITLMNNYRGDFSKHADKIKTTIEAINEGGIPVFTEKKTEEAEASAWQDLEQKLY